MTKAERLFQLYTLLRSRRKAITAEAIAEQMEVSVRTVYRDIQALLLSGIAIDGEAGIGYILRHGHEIPPLMFSSDEALSLMVGIRMVKSFTDPELAQAATLAEQKILSVLTPALAMELERQPYRIPLMNADNPLRDTHLQLRKACEQQFKIRATYTDEKSDVTERVLWPLGMIGWSGRWTLLAWCELRQDYRNFRFDRFETIEVTNEVFLPGEISIAHFFKTVLDISDFG